MTTQAPPQPSAIAREALPATAAATAARAGAFAGSRRAWWGLAALTVAAVLVFWAFEALPFQDLPAHAGLIALRHRFASSAFEQRFFVYAPHLGPYSLFRFLGEAFVRVMSPVSSVRALATLPVLATPAALLFARWRLHGDRSPTAGFYGLALSFGLMTLLGFASYLLGLAAMLVVFTLWLELMAATDTGASTRRRELVMLAVAPLMLLAHGHAFVLFLLLAGVSVFAGRRTFARAIRLRVLAPAIMLAAYVAWTERASVLPQGAVEPTPAAAEAHFQSAYDKISLLITPTLMTRTGIDFFLGVVIWAVVLACAFATVRRLRTEAAAGHVDERMSFTEEAVASKVHTRALFIGALVIAVVFFALPHAIGWFGFVDGRLVPLFLFLCLMGVRRSALPAVLRWAFDRVAPIAGFSMAALVLVASYRFQAEARGYREVLGQVPANARVLNLPIDPNSSIFTAHPFCHYDKLVLTERPIVVSDVWFHQGSALYPTAANPALRLPSTYSESDLKFVDWPAYRLTDWDYVLVRTRPEAAAPATPSSLALADHRGGWWLYTVASARAAR